MTDLQFSCRHLPEGICDGCLEDLADGCTEDEGNRTDQIDGHTTAHFAMLAMTGQCPWCGAESEVEFSSKVTP